MRMGKMEIMVIAMPTIVKGPRVRPASDLDLRNIQHNVPTRRQMDAYRRK
jgi:hypothetical protein